MLNKIASLMIGLFVPFMIGWCVFVTKQIHELDLKIAALESFASKGDRFTATDGRLLALELKDAVRMMINEHLDKSHQPNNKP